MKLTYIFHSGFAIETDTFSVLVDYFKDTTDHPDQGYVHDKLLHSDKPLYILSSHFHFDHFNPQLLRWKDFKKDIHYIFSRDILKHRRAKEGDAFFLMKGEEYKDSNLAIKAFGSTDVGVSFLINMNGRSVFHAGDLNNWHWKDESTAEEVEKAERLYLKELDLIRKATSTIDVVMFPVDSRMGTDYMRGAEQFVDTIQTGLFAPMHFGENYEQANAFKPYAESRDTAFFELREKGQSLEF